MGPRFKFWLQSVQLPANNSNARLLALEGYGCTQRVFRQVVAQADLRSGVHFSPSMVAVNGILLFLIFRAACLAVFRCARFRPGPSSSQVNQTRPPHKQQNRKSEASEAFSARTNHNLSFLQRASTTTMMTPNSSWTIRTRRATILRTSPRGGPGTPALRAADTIRCWNTASFPRSLFTPGTRPATRRVRIPRGSSSSGPPTSV